MKDKEIMLNRIIHFYVGRNDLKETELKTISDLISDLKAINYTRCCTELCDETENNFKNSSTTTYTENSKPENYA